MTMDVGRTGSGKVNARPVLIICHGRHAAGNSHKQDPHDA